MATQQEYPFQPDGTVPVGGGYGSSKQKTRVPGNEDIPSRENPKDVNTLAGFLVSFSKSEIGEYWELREGNNSIGSSAQENSVLLAEKHVSGKHANINISKDTQNNSWKLQLVDLSSTNGTELNGNRLPIYSGVEIKNNDKIKIGEYTLVLFVADKYVNGLSQNDKFQATATTQNSGWGGNQGYPDYSSENFYNNANSTGADYNSQRKGKTRT